MNSLWKLPAPKKPHTLAPSSWKAIFREMKKATGAKTCTRREKERDLKKKKSVAIIYWGKGAYLKIASIQWKGLTKVVLFLPSNSLGVY